MHLKLELFSSYFHCKILRKVNAKLCAKCIRLFKKAAEALVEQKAQTSTIPVATA